MFKVIGKYAPIPAIFPSPLLWGEEAIVRERFGNGVEDLRITNYMYPFRYPFSPAEVSDFFIANYGPTARAFQSLSDASKDFFKADMTAIWNKNNRVSDGTTDVLAEYVEVIGIRS